MQIKMFLRNSARRLPMVFLAGYLVYMTYVLVQMERTASEFKCMQTVFAAHPTTPGLNAEANKQQRNALVQQIHLQCNVEVDFEH